MDLFYDERFHLKLPEGHRFPIEKYPLIKQQLIYEGSFTESDFVLPKMATEQQLARVHEMEYIEKINTGTLSKSEIRRMGFPYSTALAEREKLITGATIDATYSAINKGIAFNLAGGTHHAYPDHGEGFCIFNDIAVAASDYIHHHPTHKVLIIDLDVHQGNGTAHIFANESRVFTFSVHGEKNYPLHKENSDRDIALPENTTDTQYLHIVNEQVTELVDFLKPDFVYYLAGVDIFENDKLGRLNISLPAIKQRDTIVFEILQKRKISVAVSMGGGYAHRLRDIVEAHCNTYRVAKALYN